MDEEYFYVKSFEEDFVLKTIKGKKKVNFQSVDNIIRTKTIKPNTKSFGKEARLACSVLHKNYLKTYRPQGLIFKAKQMPDVVFPFDLVLLTNAKKLVVQYYRIQGNLHEYYGHDLIGGFEKFVFKDFNKMVKKFPTSGDVWGEIKKFRAKAGFGALSEQKRKLIEYCEAVFHRSVKIEPVAIYGYRKIARDVAKKHGLPHFRTAKEFYENFKK